MSRTLISIAVLAFLCPPAPAGEDRPRDKASVLASLHSDQPEEIAWGAYLAGRQGLSEAGARLTELLEPHPDRESKKWLHLRLAALDALVLLDADLPEELLRHYLNGRSYTR